MELIKTKSYESVYDVDKLFGSWALCLGAFAFTPYFKNLMAFIKGIYLLNVNRKNILPTRRINVFRTFRETDYKDLRVVILGGLPYGSSSDNNGVAYSNDNVEFRHPNPTLEAIADTVGRTCYEGGYNIGFDYTLKNWQSQGVLLLNTAFTCEKARTGTHSLYYREFIRSILAQIDKEKEGVVFCYWGDAAKKFGGEIDPKFNYELFCDGPERAVYSRGEWDCDHFQKINAILERDWGPKGMIEW